MASFSPRCQQRRLGFERTLLGPGMQDERSQSWPRASRIEPSSARGGDDALRILIVEDDKMQALALEDRLVELGHSVVGIAASAPDAIAAAERQDPNLVLMDLRLADGTNGIEAAGEIRKRLGVPSIFVTAYADVQTRVSVEQVRAVELLRIASRPSGGTPESPTVG